MLSFRQLRYLEAVARHRHFGRAAEECAVSQPALSMQIRELEAVLGTTLIERRRGEIGLTETGAEVVRRARAILAELHDLTDYARHRHRRLSGPLRLGVIPSIAPYLLPVTLPRLQARYPRLELELIETQTKALLDELVGGRLDVALLSLPVEPQALEAIHLFDDAFLLATRAGRDGFAMQGRIAPDSLRPEELLLLEEGHCLRDQALAYCRAVRTDFRARFGATSLATIMQMVANGYGITLLPEISVPIELRDNPLVAVLRFTEPEPRRAIGLAWRRTSPRKADFVALGQTIEAVAREIREAVRIRLAASAPTRPAQSLARST